VRIRWFLGSKSANPGSSPVFAGEGVLSLTTYLHTVVVSREITGLVGSRCHCGSLNSTMDNATGPVGFPVIFVDTDLLREPYSN
jgi:hypothetical protein